MLWLAPLREGARPQAFCEEFPPLVVPRPNTSVPLPVVCVWLTEHWLTLERVKDLSAQ